MAGSYFIFVGYCRCQVDIKSSLPIQLLHRIKSILSYEEEGPVSYE